MSEFDVVPTASYERDLERLLDFVLERELMSAAPDDSVLDRLAATIDRGLGILSFAPHTCRRCEAAPGWRELVIPFGQTGCVALFEIRGAQVLLLALRSQREEDYR